MDIYEAANRMKLERLTIFDLPLRVTFYGRVSSTSDEQLNSIANQVGFFMDYIQKNPNWTYIQGYKDEIRGESAENRKEFLRMIQDGKSGKFDLIITKEVSRFARNTIDSLSYTRELLHAGVGVFFLNDNICTIDTDSELRLTIMSSIAQDEVRKLSERVKFGHARSIKDGVVLGNSRIFGYDKAAGRLVINEKEAEMIRLIFDLYATGRYSSRAIENVLYEKNYRSRNGTRIMHTTINNILQNPKYKGYYVGGKVKIVDYRTKEQRFLPQEEWTMYKDETGEIVPAIVSEDLWDRANQVYLARSGAVKNHQHSLKSKSVLTGKIWCVGHDEPYWRTSHTPPGGDPTYQWICAEKRRHGYKACSSIAIYETELYQILKSYILSVADDMEGYIDEFIEIFQRTGLDTDSKEQVALAEKEIERLNLKKEKLLELYTDGMITKAEFGKRNDALNMDIETQEHKIRGLQRDKEAEKAYVKRLTEIRDFFTRLFATDPDINEMTDEQMDDIIQAVIERINVTAVDPTSMKLTILLKMGIFADVRYERLKRRSGHISKKMIQQYENGLK